MTTTNSKSSPIKGIGNDIIEIDRIRKTYDLHGERFLEKLFSKEEKEYCFKHKDPIPHLAARFSAKESIVKALGTGFGKHASWQDIMILNDSLGKPYVVFSDHMNQTLNNPHVMIGISHCHLYVSTFAVWVE